MLLNNHMTQKQQKVYDRTLNTVKQRFGSYHQIALRIYANCEREVTGETVRQWFFDRRVPTHIAFVLYEMMDEQIDPLTLCPWLAEHVELKRVAARES